MFYFNVVDSSPGTSGLQAAASQPDVWPAPQSPERGGPASSRPAKPSRPRVLTEEVLEWQAEICQLMTEINHSLLAINDTLKEINNLKKIKCKNPFCVCVLLAKHALEALDESQSPPYSPRGRQWLPGLLGYRVLQVWCVKGDLVALCNVVKNAAGQNNVTHLFWCVEQGPPCRSKAEPPPLQQPDPVRNYARVEMYTSIHAD